MRFRAVCSYCARAVGPLLFLGITLWCKGGQAQNVRIKLVNGKNGRPMVNAYVNAWVGTERKDAMVIPTNEDGVASLYLTDKDAEINIQSQSKNCGDCGVLNPVVKYSDTIGINAGYVLCDSRKPDHSWLAIRKFSTAEVLRHGVVTANTCGNAADSPQSGEIIIFVRPLTWWEKFKT